MAVTKVPFHPSGGLLDYPDPRFPDEIEWRPNDEFDAVMRLAGTRRGRSAAVFMWEDAVGRRWPMFMTDAAKILVAGVAQPGGLVTGRWVVVKRGTNYGLAFVGALPPQGGTPD